MNAFWKRSPYEKAMYRRFCGKRRGLGRWMDRVAACLFGFALCFLTARGLALLPRFLLSFVALALTATALSLITKWRFLRFVPTEERRLRLLQLKTELLLLPQKELFAVCQQLYPKESILLFLQAAPVSTDDLLRRLRRRTGAVTLLLSLSPLDPAAEALFFDRYPNGVAERPETLLERIDASGLHPITRPVSQIVLREAQMARNKRGALQGRAFFSVPVRGYLGCAALLLLLSFLLRGALYYRLLSALCMSLAGIRLLIDRRSDADAAPGAVVGRNT